MARVPGEVGEKGGVDVDDAVREAGEEAGRQQLHVAGADDEADAVLLEPVRHHGVALLAARELVEREGGRRHVRPFGPLERARIRPRGGDGVDGQPRVEERLEIRALAADEDADHPATILPITSSSPGSGTTAQ